MTAHDANSNTSATDERKIKLVEYEQGPDFKNPEDLALDRQGNLIVADHEISAIRRVTASQAVNSI